MTKPGTPAPVEAPYGAWASPLSAARATAGALRLGQIALDGDDVYWLEGRASEGGRNVLVRASAGAPPVEVSPSDFNVRSRVHEYGGAAYTVHRGAIYVSNFADQRLYRSRPAVLGVPSRPTAISSPSAGWTRRAGGSSASARTTPRAMRSRRRPSLPSR